MKENKSRQFKITNLALNNRNTVILLTLVIIIFGVISFNNLPKELYPEVAFPTIMVQTVYPGNAPADIENLITRPLEKEIESVEHLKTLSSNSLQDISLITVEFSRKIPFGYEGDLYLPGCHVVHYKDDEIKEEMSGEDGSWEVCFAERPDIDLTAAFK